jgi:hypothetical protein
MDAPGITGIFLTNNALFALIIFDCSVAVPPLYKFDNCD